MSPLPEHERYSRFIEFLVTAVGEVTGANIYSYGSTTFKSEPLAKGVAPDACFYIANKR